MFRRRTYGERIMQGRPSSCLAVGRSKSTAAWLLSRQQQQPTQQQQQAAVGEADRKRRMADNGLLC